ncbi:MAG: NmrA family transcriptional regulator, partial [Streptomyces sp.]|nr:NmrA family transcriptional regulator [Streptomyces sp.]NUS76765.1 NmrA family transcriptional regulator [Streptomyces sp.]
RASVGDPVNGVVETAGPEVFQLEEFIRMGLAAQNDPRTIVTDPKATYWGAELRENTLLPGPGARLAETRFTDWLAQQA